MTQGKRLLSIALLGLAVATFGCAGGQPAQDEDTITLRKDTMLRCPKCGAEFPLEKGRVLGAR